MHSADGRFVFVFNGEIYNHLSLRGELEATRVVDWRGSSDTETLVECFAAWGVASTLHKAVGMFAFAVWDRAEHKLMLARDRFGEKPLYYGFVGVRSASTISLFGSELKAFRATSRLRSAGRSERALACLPALLPACRRLTPFIATHASFEPGSILHIRPERCRRRASASSRGTGATREVVAAGLAEPFR